MTIKITSLDLDFILTQIQMAEAGQDPVNPLLSFGLREIAGTNNNLSAGGGTFGSSMQPFPTITDPIFQNAQGGTSYAQTSGLVVDAQPRLISELIATQNASNPAALAAQQVQLSQLGDGYLNLTQPGPDGLYGTADDTGTMVPGPDGIMGTADDFMSFGNQTTPTNAASSGATIPGLAQSLFIPNITPDAGLSAPANSFFTFFGQFFDHGLDLISKDATNGTIFIPLSPDDPLYVKGAPTNFMVETRAQDLPGPDGILGTADDVHAHINQTSPFVDQSQTYGSDPSHQVFLREYIIGADGNLHSTGALLGHHAPGADNILGTADDPKVTMATWGDLKANAASFFGIKITDYDVNSVPLLATDPYGNFIAGPHGLPQLVVTFTDGTQGLVEGNIAQPVGLGLPGDAVAIDPVTGKAYHAVLAGSTFLDDKAQTANPFATSSGAPLAADTDTVTGNAVGFNPQTGDNTAYDNELLDQHYVAGDGRVNENVGLTSIQELFHSEHDRLLAQIKTTVQQNLDAGDISFATDWVLPGVVLTPGVAIADNEWNGERLFQAAKFGTETEYQHIVFDEFARYVAPAIHVAGGVNVHIDPAITSEFANVVYRFGHSMLDETIPLYQLGADGKPVLGPNGQPVMTQEGLIQAFTNPTQFANDPNMTADIILGTVNQVSASIDEFVTGSLQDNLLGLPLDLASLNIARGRDTGVAPLNAARAQLYSISGESQLKPYTSWNDFASELKHPESLVNFIAAYGTYSSIVNATTAADKRAAAQALVDAGKLGSATFSIDAYNFLNSQGAWANNKADARALHDSTGAQAQWGTGSITGLDNVDFWIGGLAEQINLNGGVLGSTFEYVFRTQMEALQDGDRLYYLPRIEGTDYEESLQDNSLAQLIRANTDIKHLPGNIFLTPEYTVEASTYFNADGSVKDPGNANNTWLRNTVTGKLLVNVTADGTLQFVGDDNFLGNTIVLGGTEGNDKLTAGAADDDTVWGDGGSDVLDGGNGADFLFGGDGDDTVIGGQGADEMHGDAGNDTMYGGDDLDTMFGGDGNDYMEGGRGDDVILGGLGNDIIIGNEGFDELTGNEGDDWLESRGGQGQLMFGDSGAPTGQVPLYSGNDVMVGGVAGGDIMKGFSGDDIMLGHGSFTKFIGGLGFDWGSYELATQGVQEDMNRKEFVAANGAVDNVRDVWQDTEGASGSAFNDIMLGTNDTKLVLSRNELDNVNLITGLQGFFDPGVVSFDGGNIMLGGAGSDVITGGGGNDILDGDAYLHVGLASYTAGAQIIRQINYDPNGNTYDPFTGLGHVNAANVDTAIYNDVMSNYNVALFGLDDEGFLTIQHNGVAVVVGANPQGLLGVDDGTDRIRNIERLQFADGTVAIDKYGNMISSSFNPIADPNYATLYAPYYDAVPFGTPTITETDPAGNVVDATVRVDVGDTLTASVATISDFDGIGTINYQWQYQDVLAGDWISFTGATSATFKIPRFLNTMLGVRVKASYVDGKGYTEQLFSTPTTAVTVSGAVNTPPRVVPQQQFNGIPNTTAVVGQPFDFFAPFGEIFTDDQTASNALTYTAVLANGQPLSTAGLAFSFDPNGIGAAGAAAAGLPGVGEFSILSGLDPNTGLPYALISGQIAIRVIATDAGGLSVADTFVINVLPLDTPPVANNDSYSILEGATLTVTPSSQGVLANDTDTDFGDRLTARLVTGPAHGTLQFNTDGTFAYTPTVNYTGSDSFTYVADDIFLTDSNVATVSLTVNAKPHTVTASLLHDTGASASDRITNDATLSGSGFAGSAVFASVDGAAPVRFATGDATTGAWSGAPTLTDGAHTIVISETNGLNGRTDFATVNFTFDTTPPVTVVALLKDTGASATDGVTSDPRLTGIGDPNSSVLLSIDGAAAKSVTTDAAGVWIDTPSVAEGNHTVNVTGSMDLAGNVGHASLAFTVDRVVPPVTAVLALDTGALATDKVTNDDTIIGAGDPNGAVFASFDGGAAVKVATGDATTGAWTFTPLLADGKHTVVVSETDLAGNKASASVSFTLDKTPPPVTVALVSDTGASAADGITKVATVTGTGDPNSSVQVTVDGVLAGSIATNAAGIWGYTPFNPTQGPHNVSVTGTDLAGNTKTANLAFTLDTVAPATPTIGGFTYNATATALTNYTLSGTGEAGSTVVLSNGATTLGAATVAANGSWSFTVTPNPTAGFSTNLTVTATDLAGNISGSQSAGVVVGTAAVNALTGLASVPNLILGLGGNDNLTGSSANNILDGGTGSDTMTGLAGNDTYVVDAVGDVVNEAAGGGTDTVLTNLATYTLGANVENLTYTGAVAFSGTGNVLANVITGGAGADTLTGGANTAGNGVDTLIGLAGNDTYNISNVGDIIVEAVGGGTDTVRTALASYTLGANLENLTYTGAGNFTGTGNNVANVITGGAGADTLDGGANTAGIDTLIGGTGNDTYIVNSATDVVTEAAGAGTDTERTALASLTLAANVENLTYTGAGNFAGTGNTLANVITGGAGADTLAGGTNTAGVDTMIGGAGDDTYVVSNSGDMVTEAAGGGTDTVRTALASFTLAANVENLTYTGAAAFSGTGNTLANVITGGAGADTLTDGTNAAGNGVDTMIGGAGADTYNVSNVGDIITEAAGGGTDTVRTTLSSYTLDANVENLTFTGAGNFAGTGNALVNTITGGTGADTLDGGKNTTGVDTLVGGAGNDTYIVNNAGDVVTEAANAGTDTERTALASLTLAANVENLTYTGAGNFAGTGNTLANVITGGAGNDTLTGGTNTAGVDTMIGGAGDDTYVVSNSGDVVTEAAGGGTDTVRTALTTFTLAANVENLTYAGATAFSGTGNNLANVITGGAGADTLTGGANTAGNGVDTLIGLAGNDTYNVSNVGDIIVEAVGGGTDTVRTTLNNYTLDANVENLTFTGAGNFAGTGNALVNTINGGAGADTLDGGKNTTGVDTLAGGAGNDTYVVRNLGDLVTENIGAGTDTVLAAVNSYTLATNVENLTFIGTGNFTGVGNAAANVIAGGTGNDSLAGGAGNDSLTGGVGADTFIMDAGFGADIITDFTAGAAGGHDVLDFASSIFANFAAMQAAATQVGANTVIAAGANTLTLTGVTKANLVAADFARH